MKQLTNETEAKEQAIPLLVDTVIRVGRIVRREVRRTRPAGLSLQDARTLTFVDEHPGSALSDVAMHLGVGMPTTSKVVDSLTRRSLLRRATCLEDRRRLALEITPAGARAKETAFGVAHARVEELLVSMSEEDRAQMLEVLEKLRPLVNIDPGLSRAAEPADGDDRRTSTTKER
jgi:DNA-binding MarR family transcriptional regulator